MAELPITLGTLISRLYRGLHEFAVEDKITDAMAAAPAAGTLNQNVQTPALWPVNSKHEIDSEIFLVTVGGTNPITLRRAQMGTIAAAHADDAPTRRDPRYLRADIVEAINVALGDWCSTLLPRIDWDTTTAGTFTPTRSIYKAPTWAKACKRIGYLEPGMTGFVPLSHGGLRDYDSAVVDTEKGVEVWEPGYTGATVRMELERDWPYLELDADQVPTDFPENGVTLLIDGAALYLAGWKQFPRWRQDEIQSFRELGSAVRNVEGVLARRAEAWLQRALQVRSRRASGSAPQKVWR